MSAASALDICTVPSDISVMTEKTDKTKLPAVVERFILHWGDMGDVWGVNRSVSQIHGADELHRDRRRGWW